MNGKAEVVVQDAAACQQLVTAVARRERDDTIAAIRAGLAEVEAGRTKPARTVLNRLARKYGLPEAGK